MESVYRAYKDSFELFADIAEIIRQEASDLAMMGCVYIQIDTPELAVLIDRAAHPRETRRCARKTLVHITRNSTSRAN